jgi:hypothetical protein
MPSWIYCGTAQQVDAAKTQALLRSHQAIWFPHLLSVSRGLSLTRKLERLYGWFGVESQEILSLCLAEAQSCLLRGNFSGPQSFGPTQTILEYVMLQCS